MNLNSVKWSGFDDKSATWEPSKNIPLFIQKVIFYMYQRNMINNIIFHMYQRNMINNIIFQYFCEKSRFGKPLPQPRIKHTKMAGKGWFSVLHQECLYNSSFVGEKYHLLQWGDAGAGDEEWLKESIFDLDSDNMVPEVSSCNTRKVFIIYLI